MTKAKTAISINEDLLKEAGNIAQELEVPRSQVVSMALEEYVRRYRNKQLLEQINEAYSEAPDSDEVGTMKIIRSHQRNFGEHDEWR